MSSFLGARNHGVVELHLHRGRLHVRVRGDKVSQRGNRVRGATIERVAHGPTVRILLVAQSAERVGIAARCVTAGREKSESLMPINTVQSTG